MQPTDLRDSVSLQNNQKRVLNIALEQKSSLKNVSNEQINSKSYFCQNNQLANKKQSLSRMGSKRQKLNSGQTSEILNTEQMFEQMLQVKNKKKTQQIYVTRGVATVEVDEHSVQGRDCSVFELNKCFYSLTLNMSDIANNCNKFIIIQLLKNASEQFYLFKRWGRVGTVGQVFERGPMLRKEAIKLYHSSIGEKTKRGYKVVHTSFQKHRTIDVEDYISEEMPSKLQEKVQDLVRLIFDLDMMNRQMREVGYDDKNTPLKCIGKVNIEQGYELLGKLLAVIKDNSLQTEQRKLLLNQLSGQFYSTIPHDFGYINMQAFVLDTADKIQSKLEMLASLNQISLYSKLMDAKSQLGLNQIDANYIKLNIQMHALTPNSRPYVLIQKYISNTHGKTHDKYSIHLLNIFAINRKNDKQIERIEEQEEQKSKQNKIGNLMLLWHGSRLTNYVGILSQGLKIAPNTAPATGYMFSKGIYFADMVSKAANYCLPSRRNDIGLLLLCEVALGTPNKKYAADPNSHLLPPATHSTQGVGQMAPTSGEYLDRAWVPNDEVKPTGVEDTALLYNEYVVYDPHQIQCKYLVQVRFAFK